MGFHWYIDIEEEQTGKKFSAGPIVLESNQNMNVGAFVDKVNTAFLEVFESGVHDTLYTLGARMAALDSGASNGVAPGMHAHQDAAGSQVVHADHSNVNGAHSHGSSTPGNELVWATNLPPSVSTVSPTFELARDNRQFVVEYRIENSGGRRFKINFATGEHGQAVPDTHLPGHADLGGTPPRAAIRVTNISNVQPLLLKHCTVSSIITDKPPVPPDMHFVPYRGVNDRLLVLFAPNVGRRHAKPILLATSDSSFIIEEYYSQKEITVDPANLDAVQETLEYASDDPVRTYEIFRLDTMPTSYSSFIDNRLATVETQLAPQKYSTGVSYLDTLLPNVKYYYCGRSIDRHKNISNPTPVTEVELVDNNGQLYLNKKIFTFPTIPQRPTKSARRILAIEPAQLQTAYSLESSTIAPGQAEVGTAPPPNEIGIAADEVWEKKFKIRLTSQKTGKKMDLNITFKNTGVTNP